MFQLALLVRLAVPFFGPIQIQPNVVVRFDGNQSLDESALASALDQSDGYRSILVDQGIERDALRIYAAYCDHGFIQAKVTQEVALSGDYRTVTATFHIEEGEPFHIGRAQATGDSLGLLPALAASGEIVNRSKIMEAERLLARRYHDRGYAFLEVTPLSRVDPEQHLLDITFEITPGPIVHFGAIHTSAALPPLSIKPGDRFSDASLDALRRELSNHHLQAQISVQPAGPTTADLLIDLDQNRGR